MKKLYLLLLSTFALGQSFAQCAGGRYMNEIFPSITKDSVKYSTTYNQWMDIYQPVGDTFSARPVIILGHGGSFITGNGDRKTDPTVDSLCIRFAKRGYVTISIDYRTTSAISVLDSATMVDEVVKAISDGKAAIRFFMNDRSTTNTYKIDTNNIFVGGNSAGAVLYMHVAYMTSPSECPSYITAAMAANGGFEGNSGYPGYNVKTKAVINLAGALNMVSLIQAGDKPSVNAQGDNDVIVPYNCGRPLTGVVPVNLCGLGVLEPAYVANGIYHMSKVFPGDPHVPWSNNLAKLYSVDSMVKIFLYNMVCNTVNEVNEVSAATEVILFPNPATESFNVKSTSTMAEVAVYDQTGRTVFITTSIDRDNYEINTRCFSKGVYFVKIRFSNGDSFPVVRRLTVE